MISRARQFLFVHVPKTGGNSIQNILKAYSEDEILLRDPHQDGVERFEVRNATFGFLKHSPLSEYKERLPGDSYASLFKFACVRNPWERAISYYFSPYRGVTDFSKGDFIEFMSTTVPMTYFLREAADQPLAEVPANFDAILRFETLQADFDAVCDRLSIPRQALPVRNRSARGAAAGYYDEETVEVVRKAYAEDIALFGYDVPWAESAHA
jgi:hypothetical protein